MAPCSALRTRYAVSLYLLVYMHLAYVQLLLESLLEIPNSFFSIYLPMFFLFIEC